MYFLWVRSPEKIFGGKFKIGWEFEVALQFVCSIHTKKFNVEKLNIIKNFLTGQFKIFLSVVGSILTEQFL